MKLIVFLLHTSHRFGTSLWNLKDFISPNNKAKSSADDYNLYHKNKTIVQRNKNEISNLSAIEFKESFPIFMSSSNNLLQSIKNNWRYKDIIMSGTITFQYITSCLAEEMNL